jgi:hypothetical protein
MNNESPGLGDRGFLRAVRDTPLLLTHALCRVLRAPTLVLADSESAEQQTTATVWQNIGLNLKEAWADAIEREITTDRGSCHPGSDNLRSTGGCRA